MECEKTQILRDYLQNEKDNIPNDHTIISYILEETNNPENILIVLHERFGGPLIA